LSERKINYFAIRTTLGQEYNVALILKNRAAKTGSIYSIVVLPSLRGMVIIETIAPFMLAKLIVGIKHAKGVVRGAMTYDELSKFLVPKPIIDIVKVNDVVEIIGGPFMGMKGRVIQIDKSRSEVKIEVSEAAYPLPITINADYIKIVKSSEEREE